MIHRFLFTKTHTPRVAHPIIAFIFFPKNIFLKSLPPQNFGLLLLFLKHFGAFFTKKKTQ